MDSLWTCYGEVDNLNVTGKLVTGVMDFGLDKLHTEKAYQHTLPLSRTSNGPESASFKFKQFQEHARTRGTLSQSQLL